MKMISPKLQSQSGFKRFECIFLLVNVMYGILNVNDLESFTSYFTNNFFPVIVSEEADNQNYTVRVKYFLENLAEAGI